MSSPASRSAHGLAGRAVSTRRPHGEEPLRNATPGQDAGLGLARHQPDLAPPVPFRSGAHTFPPRITRECISVIARCLVPLCGGTTDAAWERRAMGQVLHGSATTTAMVRRAIQARQESVRAAAKR